MILITMAISTTAFITALLYIEKMPLITVPLIMPMKEMILNMIMITTRIYETIMIMTVVGNSNYNVPAEVIAVVIVMILMIMLNIIIMMIKC